MYIIFVAFCFLAYYVYTKLINVYKYWDNRGVKGPKPVFPYGNVKTVIFKKDSMGSLVGKIYKDFPDEKVIGIYQGVDPILVVKDPDLVMTIMAKDFNCFTDRGVRINDEPLSRNLFGLDGDEWKVLRQKLAPLFSTGKLRQMMPLLDSAVKEYMQYLDKLVEKQIPYEIRDLNMKYTLKTITSVLFGLDINTYTDDPNQFIEMANRLFKRSNFLLFLAALIDGLIPGVFQKIPIDFASKKITYFFSSLVSGIIKNREGKPKTRKDFMELLIELKEQGSITKTTNETVTELKIDDDMIAAQALIFYAAGFETSSGAMSFLMYELAKNQNIQDRCYEEIKGVIEKYEGELTYEAINELEYVSMALDEALRAHSVSALHLRKCISEYKVPELNLIIEKDTKIFIPLLAIQNDPKYFPEPEKFDPERFAADKRANIHNGTYSPFGHGPRNCIAIRFAKVQSLLGIAKFLYNFRLRPSEKTPSKIIYDPNALVLTSLDGIALNIERR